MNLIKALSYGGTVTIIGMVIVFTGLALLIACVSIMAAVFKSINKKKEQQKVVEAPKAEPAPVAEPAVEETEEVDDPELIAVIAAAIAAFDDSGKQLVVRKVRRVNGWNRAAREEQICRF